MGLDMYAMAVPASEITTARQVDVDLPESKEEIFYWRKHPDLHGWMEDLYRRKGGKDESFNCNTVRLDLDDLAELERDIHQLPHTEGFFFGSSSPEDSERDKQFIAKARQAIAEGKAVFYDSWW